MNYIEKWLQYVKKINACEEIKNILCNDYYIEHTPAYYFFYPKLFLPVIEPSKVEALENLCHVGFLCYSLAIITDTKEDLNLRNSDQLENKIKELFVTNYYSVSKTHIGELKNILKDKIALYAKRNFYEKELQASFSYNYYKQLDICKSALSQLAIDLIKLLFHNYSDAAYKELIHAHDNFSIGLQILDDIKDFKEDISIGQFNYAYYLLKRKYPNDNDIDKLNKLLYIDSTASELYVKASYYFKNAFTIAKKYELTVWITYLEEFIIKCQQAISQIDGYKISLLKKIELEKSPVKYNYSIFKQVNFANSCSAHAWTYFISQAETGFPEVKHLMYLSKNEGFQNTSHIHVGEIFQRAIIAEIILSLPQAKDLSDYYLANEIDFIVSQKEKDNVKAWKYFSSVKQISCDIDDLGQILQVLCKANQTDIAEKHCRKIIDKIIIPDDYCDTSGAFETWIMPQKKKTSLQKIQSHYNETKWGKGPDVEVNANFGIGLYLFDKDKYAKHLLSIASYLKSNQSEKGYWSSRWYYGKYYGTYICCKFLKVIQKYDKNIYSALEFIYNSQNADGGWGIEDMKSDALNSALALITLLDNEMLLIKREKIELGIKYLYASFDTSKRSWPSTKFIYPRFNDPYESCTISTIFSIHALSLYQQKHLD